MENRLKTRISRIFRNSLSACRARHLLDVDENAVFIPEDHLQAGHQPPPLPNCNGLPSMCKPRYCCNEVPSLGMINSSIVPRRNLSSFSEEEVAKSCLPASTRFPSMNQVSLTMEGTSVAFGCRSYKKSKKNKKRDRKGVRHQERNREVAALSRSCSMDSSYYYNWFSSEEEDDVEKGQLPAAEEGEDSNSLFFSSRSNTNTLSSDSSGVTTSKRRAPTRRTGRPTSEYNAISHNYAKRVDKVNNTEAHGADAKVKDRRGVDRPCIKDSFAVVKTSEDPYTDFRTSMVEMIIEKQIFGAEELEHLLQCFLFLNSEHHHKIIVDVFTEIWEALFSC